MYWGDVVPEMKQHLALPDNYFTRQYPSVAYRGIFINDEDWSSRVWAQKIEGKHAKKGEMGPRFYKHVFELFPRLEERREQVAGTLSGGEQQLLAMGRALMSRPKLLLLDEPSMGLAPLLIREIFHIIEDINKEGTTVLLVAQNANMALSIASRAYVLETGRITLSGDAAKLAASEDVRKAYLGG